MSSLLRRLPVTRLLLLCGALVAAGASGAAIASAVDTGPLPEPKSLAHAIHDVYQAAPVDGITARIQYTNHLLEGASLAGAAGSAGQLASSPLLQGASGRLWVAKDGRVRLELQAEGGDTEVILDNRTVSIYGVAPDTVYRYTLPQHQEGSAGAAPGSTSGGGHSVPSVAKIEEALSHLSEHANVVGATPANIAGQSAYTARVSPKERGSLLGAAELSWDAVHGIPLRAAIYSSHSASPVIELAASEISYGPVASSVFEIKPEAGAKIVEPQHREGPEAPSRGATPGTPTPPAPATDQGHPHVKTIGHGITSVLALETPTPANGGKAPSLPSGLQKVDINGATAYELPTALGTILSFERAGVSYVVGGALNPPAVEAAARGL
jgi:outer membrane lipoprotein-sorting protein